MEGLGVSVYGGRDEGQEDLNFPGNQSCDVCGSTELESVGGFLSCRACGAQSQDYQEGVIEFPQAIDRRRVRRIRQRVGTSQLESIEERIDPLDEDYRDMVLTPLKHLQTTLFKQVSALTSSGKCQPILKQAVSEIWFAMLSEDLNIKKMQQLLAGELEGMESEQKTEQCKALLSNITVHYDIEKTLSVILLGCLIIKEAVMPIDLVRYALNGELPYLKETTLGKGGISRLEPDTPSVDSVLKNMLQIVEQIGTHVPRINVGGLVTRLLHEINLPPEVALHVHKLHCFVAVEMEPHLAISGRQTYMPGSSYSYVVGLVVVTLKILYGLDGRKTFEGSGELPCPPASWTTWASEVMARRGPCLQVPWLSEDVLRLSPDKISPFLNFLDSHIFSDTVPSPLQQLHNNICTVAKETSCSLTGHSADDTDDSGHDTNRGGSPVPHDTSGDGVSRSKGQNKLVTYGKYCTAFHRDYQAVIVVSAFAFCIKTSFIHYSVRQIERWIILRQSRENLM